MGDLKCRHCLGYGNVRNVEICVGGGVRSVPLCRLCELSLWQKLEWTAKRLGYEREVEAPCSKCGAPTSLTYETAPMCQECIWFTTPRPKLVKSIVGGAYSNTR